MPADSTSRINTVAAMEGHPIGVPHRDFFTEPGAAIEDNILGTVFGDRFRATQGCSGTLKHQIEKDSHGA